MQKDLTVGNQHVYTDSSDTESQNECFNQSQSKHSKDNNTSLYRLCVRNKVFQANHFLTDICKHINMSNDDRQSANKIQETTVGNVSSSDIKNKKEPAKDKLAKKTKL